MLLVASSLSQGDDPSPRSRLALIGLLISFAISWFKKGRVTPFQLMRQEQGATGQPMGKLLALLMATGKGSLSVPLVVAVPGT